MLQRHPREVDGCDKRPQLDRVHQTSGHALADSQPGLGGGASCQQRLHSEEIRIKNWREGQLIDDDLDGNGEPSVRNRRDLQLGEPDEPAT